MSAPPFDADLLQPSLSARDDVVGFDRPWNPFTIVLWTFFGGVTCGGILYGLNFRRLGWPRYRWPTIFGAVVIAFTMQLIILWGLGHFDWFDDASQSLIRQSRRGVGVVAALIVAASQKKRYQLAVNADVPTGSLWLPGFLSLVGGMAIDFGLFMISHRLIPFERPL